MTHNISRYRHIAPALVLLTALAGCSDNLSAPADDALTDHSAKVIHIGGVDVGDALLTTASPSLTRTDPLTPDAADVATDWLRDPLFGGWDVTYWLKANNYDTHRIARVTLQRDDAASDLIQRDDNGLPDYTFKYRVNGKQEAEWPEALWHGDGVHIFRGEYVPEHLYTAAPADLTTHQNTATNYDLLSHYLSMGPQCEIVASVARTWLPYRHRLARLMLYILIDPNLKNSDGSRATIKGYQLVDGAGQADPDGQDDPSTSAIEFSKMDVLQQVTKTDNVELDGHSTFTPVWTNETGRIIPHSLGEFGTIDEHGKAVEGLEDNCIIYYDDFRETYLIPSSKRWKHYHKQTAAEIAANDTIVMIDYGKVPCYDLIVRPTYTARDSVMYDEDFTVNSMDWYDTHTNAFDVKITLSNGLTHTSHITFNLDANYQLAGYIFVNREEVDYEKSDAVLWNERVHQDGWYGPDNALGHTLSHAGSSWQRAFRIGSAAGLDGCGADIVTDGNFYNKDTGGDRDGAGQYLSEADWKAFFQSATSDGAHHGDYFILDNDITLDGGITFTGHLDAQGHTVTFTSPLTGLDGCYSTAQESDPNATWQANVHLENGLWVPWKTTDFGYRAEILNAVIANDNFVPMDAAGAYTSAVTGYIYHCCKAGTPVVWYPDHMKAIPQY